MGKARKNAAELQDERVLEMRQEGKSFATIAKAEGYDRVSDAPIAFNRAMRRRPADQQAKLGKAELVRLDELEKRVRADSELTEDTAARRLKAVEKLRTLTQAP